MRCEAGFSANYARSKCITGGVQGCMVLSGDGKSCDVCDGYNGWNALQAGVCTKAE